MIRTAFLARAFCAAALLTQTPAAAIAGAWTQSQGHGQVIVTGTYTQSTRQFDATGNTEAIPKYDKFESGLLVEYGITDWLTAMVQPQTRAATIDAPTNARSSGLGYTELGGRARLWSNSNSVFSGQIIGRIPGQNDASNPAETGNTDPELDMRVLAGRSFALGTWPAFLDAQFGYRVRFDDPPNEVRVDLTLGMRPHAQLLFLLQSFNTIADGSAAGVFENEREHKVELSAVWDFAPDWSVQVGGIATVAGEYTLRERGLVAALWHRF